MYFYLDTSKNSMSLDSLAEVEEYEEDFLKGKPVTSSDISSTDETLVNEDESGLSDIESTVPFFTLFSEDNLMNENDTPNKSYDSLISGIDFLRLDDSNKTLSPEDTKLCVETILEKGIILLLILIFSKMQI